MVRIDSIQLSHWIECVYSHRDLWACSSSVVHLPLCIRSQLPCTQGHTMIAHDFLSRFRVPLPPFAALEFWRRCCLTWSAPCAACPTGRWVRAGGQLLRRLYRAGGPRHGGEAGREPHRPPFIASSCPQGPLISDHHVLLVAGVTIAQLSSGEPFSSTFNLAC